MSHELSASRERCKTSPYSRNRIAERCRFYTIKGPKRVTKSTSSNAFHRYSREPSHHIDILGSTFELVCNFISRLNGIEIWPLKTSIVYKPTSFATGCMSRRISCIFLLVKRGFSILRCFLCASASKPCQWCLIQISGSSRRLTTDRHQASPENGSIHAGENDENNMNPIQHLAYQTAASDSS